MVSINLPTDIPAFPAQIEGLSKTLRPDRLECETDSHKTEYKTQKQSRSRSVYTCCSEPPVVPRVLLGNRRSRTHLSKAPTSPRRFCRLWAVHGQGQSVGWVEGSTHTT